MHGHINGFNVHTPSITFYRANSSARSTGKRHSRTSPYPIDSPHTKIKILNALKSVATLSNRLPGRIEFHPNVVGTIPSRHRNSLSYYFLTLKRRNIDPVEYIFIDMYDPDKEIVSSAKP
ncbi:MAG: hypothetical protein ACLFSU_04595, partial [Acholeplasmataceae bacterium]